MNKDELENKLKEKLEKEFEEYKEKLKDKSLDEIFNLAFQISTKEEIVYCMDNCSSLNTKQLMALYNAPNSLEEIYNDYSNADYSYYDNVIESAIYASNVIIGREKDKIHESR